MKRTLVGGLLGLAVIGGCTTTTTHAAPPPPAVTVTVQPPITEPSILPLATSDDASTEVAATTATPLTTTTELATTTTSTSTGRIYKPGPGSAQSVDDHVTVTVIEWQLGPDIPSLALRASEANVEICVTGMPDGITFSSGPWTVRDITGQGYAASTEPKFQPVLGPRDDGAPFPIVASHLDDGSCTAGWLVFVTPMAKTIESVVYVYDQSTELSWAVTS